MGLPRGLAQKVRPERDESISRFRRHDFVRVDDPLVLPYDVLDGIDACSQLCAQCLGFGSVGNESRPEECVDHLEKDLIA